MDAGVDRFASWIEGEDPSLQLATDFIRARSASRVERLYRLIQAGGSRDEGRMGNKPSMGRSAPPRYG
jgi:hypothetical protein